MKAKEIRDLTYEELVKKESDLGGINNGKTRTP